jgi:hypothetical protein
MAGEDGEEDCLRTSQLFSELKIKNSKVKSKKITGGLAILPGRADSVFFSFFTFYF